MSVVSMKQLLESGVHFGHATRRWNPKMAKYIYTSRNGIYIIDLQKTAAQIEEAYAALLEIVNKFVVVFGSARLIKFLFASYSLTPNQFPALPLQ